MWEINCKIHTSVEIAVHKKHLSKLKRGWEKKKCVTETWKKKKNNKFIYQGSTREVTTCLNLSYISKFIQFIERLVYWWNNTTLIKNQLDLREKKFFFSNKKIFKSVFNNNYYRELNVDREWSNENGLMGWYAHLFFSITLPHLSKWAESPLWLPLLLPPVCHGDSSSR